MLRQIAAAVEAAETIDEIRGLEATAAASYFDAWVGHPSVVPRFATADQRRVPSHWSLYDGRRSLLGKGNANRRAASPTNALLNVLHRLAAIEARLACLVVGLDPGFGALHLDAVNRDSLILDLLEPVRPEVDRFVIDLMAESTFTRKDFIERSDGSIRIGPSLAQRLSSTMPVWAKSVSPYSEQMAHTFGQLFAGKWEPRTPLTRRNARAAAAVVKARKQRAVAKGQRSAVARSAAPRGAASGAARGFASCLDSHVNAWYVPGGDRRPALPAPAPGGPAAPPGGRLVASTAPLRGGFVPFPRGPLAFSTGVRPVQGQ